MAIKQMCVALLGCLTISTALATQNATLNINNLTWAGDTRQSVAVGSAGGQAYTVCSSGLGQPPCPHKETITVRANKKLNFKVDTFYFFGKYLLIADDCNQSFAVKPGEVKTMNIIPAEHIDEFTTIHCAVS